MGEYEPNDSRNVTGSGAPQGEGVRAPGGADQQQGQPRWNEASAQAQQQQGNSGGQMGGQQNQGQQSQFETDRQVSQLGSDAQTGQQSGGIASQIREHMDVIGADGVHVGTVDHVDGNRIKLTKKDSGAGFAGGSHEGHHHYISIGLVAGVEGDKVRLSANGDVAYGMEEEK